MKRIETHLHEHYLHCRSLAETGLFDRRTLQITFETLPYTLLGPDTWRPTHITREALQIGVESWSRPLPIQRAHGLLNRMDRFQRAIELLEGPERTFDEWWELFANHDLTVIVSKREHNSRVEPKIEDLIQIPEGARLFPSAAVGFKTRISQEGVWLFQEWKKLGAPGNASEALIKGTMRVLSRNLLKKNTDKSDGLGRVSLTHPGEDKIRGG